MLLGNQHSAEIIYEARRVSSPRAKSARIAIAQLATRHTDDFIEDTLALLRAGPMESKEWAAEALHGIAVQSTDNARSLGRMGLKALISLTDTGSHAAQAHASAAVALIINSDEEYVAKACKYGVIGLLTRVLRSGTGHVQEQAAAALASIASVEEQVKPLIRSGAVPLLAALLRSSNSRAAARAAEAIGRIASTPEGQQHSYKAGAVRHLLGLLDLGVCLAAQECAARALAALAHEHLAIQQEICKLGGVKTLVATLSVINTEVQTQAAAVLSQLCMGVNGRHRRRTQEAITKAGGIGPLLAAVDTALAKQPLVAQATHTLAMLARANRANQDAIATHNGIRPLVEQLLPTRPDGDSNTALSQANAALALTWICRSNTANQHAVAELGGITQICVLLKRGAPDGLVEAEAAGALWSLADANEANKATIANSGAIVTLCDLLDAKNERAQSQAAKALSALSLGNEANQAQTASLLVAALVKSGAWQTSLRERLLGTLWKLVRDNPDSKVKIAKAGGAEPLVMLLRDGDDEGIKTFALWAMSLALDESFCRVIVDRDGITPLVNTLISPSLVAIEQAATALAKLAAGSDEARDHIARAGGVAPLVTLLDGKEANSSPNAQRDAAAALAELALLPHIKVSIERNGGITPLVELLYVHAETTAQNSEAEVAAIHAVTNNSKRFAAAALARLSMDVAAKARAARGQRQQAVDKQAAAERLAAMQGGMSLAEQIAQAGAITPLVGMLGGDAGLEAQEEAAGALCELAAYEKNRLAITESGAIGPLVSLLACDRAKARERAEAALVRLSIENANRVLIIKQLVGMLLIDPAPYQSLAEKKAGDASKREDAAKAKGALEDAKKAVAEARKGVAEAEKKGSDGEKKAAELGVRRASADVEKKATAEATIRKIAQDATRRAADEEKAQEQAAAALVNLASDSEDNRVTIVNAGGIPALLELLNGDSSSAKESTLGAIIAMSKDSRPRQEAIAKAGGISLLVQALQMGASKSDASMVTLVRAPVACHGSSRYRLAAASLPPRCRLAAASLPPRCTSPRLAAPRCRLAYHSSIYPWTLSSASHQAHPLLHAPPASLVLARRRRGVAPRQGQCKEQGRYRRGGRHRAARDDAGQPTARDARRGRRRPFLSLAGECQESDCRRAHGRDRASLHHPARRQLRGT